MPSSSTSMSLWEWYGRNEHTRVLVVCEAIAALEFLAKSADEQAAFIPDCAACETWHSMVTPLNDVLSSTGQSLPAPVFAAMTTLWELCNSLKSEAAFRCGDRSILHEAAWQLIRIQASELLLCAFFSEVRPDLKSLIDTCREQLCR